MVGWVGGCVVVQKTERERTTAHKESKGLPCTKHVLIELHVRTIDIKDCRLFLEL